MGLIGGAYWAWLFFPLLINPGIFAGSPWEGGPLQIILFYSLRMVLSATFLAISTGGAVGLLTLPMSEEHRGILAFFVMLGSLFPIAFLSFRVLNSIPSFLPPWQLLIVGIIWGVLLWMVVKVLHAPRKVHA
jgi:hypothetical protein